MSVQTWANFEVSTLPIIFFRKIGKYKKALKFFKEALQFDRELGRQPYVAIRLNNIGAVYSKMKQYEKAVVYYQKALAIDKQLNRRSSMAAPSSITSAKYFGNRNGMPKPKNIIERR